MCLTVSTVIVNLALSMPDGLTVILSGEDASASQRNTFCIMVFKHFVGTTLLCILLQAAAILATHIF